VPRSFGLSILLHIALIILLAVGIPVLFPRDTELAPNVVSVEIVPVREFTNLKPSQKPISMEDKPKPKSEKPVPKTMKEQSVPEVKKDLLPMPDAPKPPEKKPEEKPKDEPKPKDQVKPKDKQPDKKPEEKKKPDEEDEFAALLSKLKQESSESDKKEKPKPDDKSKDKNLTQSEDYNPSLPLSMSEKDAIRSQFRRCWKMPAGARNDYNLAVRVRVIFNEDGSVQEVGLVSDQVSRYQSDTFFRMAADNAIRAVELCSPLKNLPVEKYDSWRDVEFNFDPKDMLY